MWVEVLSRQLGASGTGLKLPICSGFDILMVNRLKFGNWVQTIDYQNLTKVKMKK